MAGTMILPGVSVLAQDAATVTFGLESDIRGVEPALGYDFTANPVICNITEGLLMIDAKGAVQPLLAEKFDHPDALTCICERADGGIDVRPERLSAFVPVEHGWKNS